LAFCAAVPPMNLTCSVEPLTQVLPMGDIARERPPARRVGWKRI
jgi:hypothetical protein